jgi:hypothetical protein
LKLRENTRFSVHIRSLNNAVLAKRENFRSRREKIPVFIKSFSGGFCFISAFSTQKSRIAIGINVAGFPQRSSDKVKNFANCQLAASEI